jgi:hypothetical protein
VSERRSREPNDLKSGSELADRQELAAQFSKNFAFHTLGRCSTIAIFFAHINSELVHGIEHIYAG